MPHRNHSEGMMRPTSSPSSENNETLCLRSLDVVDSWVEIGSRPSSSSLSSAADNEIVTTGLRVQHDSNLHRQRRRPRNSSQFQVGTGHRITIGGGGNSSQEEYDESESESDRVMTSSNEGIGPSPLQNQIRPPFSQASSDTMSEREDDDDDDENATAVNYPRSSRRHFEPRPNAFSHPNTQPSIRSQSGTAYTPRRPAPRTSSQRHSYPQHSPYNTLSPNAQAEHDEVLRASLSTLLSAAAAVRGLPKPGQSSRNATSNASTRVDPTTLRMVPESVVLGDIAEESSNRTTSTGAPSTSSPRTASSSPSEKSKRKASPPPPAVSTNKDRRAVKKVRRVGPMIEDISPTLLTWVISASVLAIVGVVSFSTGYSLGKEAGHAEAAGQLGGAAGACSKEVKGAGMGLKRLRWTGGSGVRA